MNFGISTLCKKLSWTPCNNRKKMWCAKNSFSQKARILCCSKWFMTHMFYTNKQHLQIPRKTKMFENHSKGLIFLTFLAFKQCVWCQNLTHVNFLAITVNKFWQQMSFLFYLSLIQGMLTPLEKQQNLSILKSKLPLVLIWMEIDNWYYYLNTQYCVWKSVTKVIFRLVLVHHPKVWTVD